MKTEKEITEDINNIDWEYVEQFIKDKGFTWSIKEIKNQYRKNQSGEYVSFSARQIINNCILPRLNNK